MIKGGMNMTEILTTIAYVSGGIALGFLVEYPFYNTIATTREKYSTVMAKIS
jgi:hypothetical protein